MINLSEKLGEMTFDGLITDIKPAPEVRGGVIRKLSAAATLKRGHHSLPSPPARPATASWWCWVLRLSATKR